MILLKLAFSSSIIYHQFKTYDINNNDLNKDYVNKGIFFSIILVSISTLFHCILTVIRYYIIIDVKKASLEISKIGIFTFMIREYLFNW